MKMPVRIGLGIAALVVVVAIVFLARPKPEPEYNGKPLSEWLTQFVSNYPRYDYKAIEALNAMGEPAVRCLSRVVEKEDSLLTQKLLNYSDKLLVLAEVVPSKYWDRYVAIKALGGMGTNAASAIPVLEKTSQASNELAQEAVAALVLVRNEPVEKYISDYLDYGSTNSSKAYSILLRLGPRARVAIPTLLKELQSTNDRVRLRASTVLQYAGIESPECVSVFTNLLSDSNSLIRVQAIHGLANCGEMAKHMAPLVAAMLDDPDRGCRSSALVYLLQVIPPEKFQPYSAAVQRATNDVDQLVRNVAKNVLAQKTLTPR